MNEIKIQLASTRKALPAPQDLEFGRHFTDHWFFSKFSESNGWHQSTIEPYGKLTLDPAASVFHYGQSLFEGMKAFMQQDNSIALFRPEFNHERMSEGAARLCLEAPPKDLFLSALQKLIQTDARWVLPEDSCSLYVRPTLIGTEPFLGVRPAREILFYILLSPVRSYYSVRDRPLRIWIENDALRAAPGGLGATKAGANYAASLQAAQKAKQRGYDQVLWLDVDRQGIEEAGTMNAFFVFKNEVVTPGLNGSILAGGMRDSVLQVLRHYKKPVVERKLTLKEVFEQHKAGTLLEAFGTGTAAVIAPIGELGYKSETMTIGNGKTGELSQWLAKLIKGIQYGREPDQFGWMKSISDLC